MAELKASLNNHQTKTKDEGEIGEDGGEFGQENTKSALIINVPFIALLHSNYERMKIKEDPTSQQATIRIPL